LANGQDVQFSGPGHQLEVSPSSTVTLDGAPVGFGSPASQTVSTNQMNRAVIDSLIARTERELIIESSLGGVQGSTEFAVNSQPNVPVLLTEQLPSARSKAYVTAERRRHTDGQDDLFTVLANDWDRRDAVSSDVVDSVFRGW
jgi:hypothetical protein